MAKRQHVKNKDKNIQRKLELIADSTERRVMPRPVVFKDKTKYDRKKVKRELCMAY